MKLISVVGARPNFMKVAPFIRAVSKYNTTHKDNLIKHLLVHTGQHYDDRMSKMFFDDLSIPAADINLGIGSGSHAEQVGYSMIGLEKIFLKELPDWVVVYGDVNATLAASITAKKMQIKVCHIEAGLRSGDLSMPEEINRIVTDRLADLLLVPDRIALQNLIKEGISTSAIKFVGNIMIDTLENNISKAKNLNLKKIIQNNMIVQKDVDFLSEGNYTLITLHRPVNVDNKQTLSNLVNFIINDVSKKVSVIWPIHPRTEKQLKNFNLWDTIAFNKNIFVVYPLGYIEMLRLNMSACMALTDSGGLQEECTVLGTPCLTMRWNTERPVTLREHGGVNVLVGNNVERIKNEFLNTLSSSRKPKRPELWDGNTAERCLLEIVNFDINK